MKNMAIISESDYEGKLLKKLRKKFYEGSVKGLVSTLIEKKLLSCVKKKELKKFWKDSKSSL